jgi:adenylate cyclase
MERRLAAILAADVVGYSRLMGEDEEATLLNLKAYRAIIDGLIGAHRGRVFGAAGDSVLAEFASPVEAVRCAVGVQQAMAARNSTVAEGQRLTFRIGVNLGDVMNEGSDVYGDGVNIAARLEALADPGGILVSQAVHEHVERKLPVRFEDRGEQNLKNIARPIKVYRIGWDSAPAGAAPKPATAASGLSDKTSIAVLPFNNMSSDPEQDFFADGLAEDLITDLSKVLGFLVIARNSSFAYRGRAVDIRAVAKDLGVRYVLEGSVRRVGSRVRINAQLIDAATGSHVWADRFDRDLADIFVVQDEVIGKIVAALAGALPSAGAAPKRRATSVEVYDLFVRGRALAIHSLQETRVARPLLRKAIQLDPGFAEAHAWLAMSHHFGWLYWGEAAEEQQGLARAAARQAVALDPENADAHIVLGYLRAYEGDLAPGIAEAEQGLKINPNHAEGWIMLGDIQVFEGKAEAAIESIRNAFRLNPHPPGMYYWMLGWAEYAAGRYQKAVDALRHETVSGPSSQRILAGALAPLSHTAAPPPIARAFHAEFPSFSTRQWAATQPFRDDAHRQHFVQGFIKAGLAE